MPEIKFTISSERYADFKEKFLKVHPNTRTVPNPDFDDQDENSPQQIPQYTDNDWIWQFLKEFLVSQYRRGEKMLYSEAQSRTDINDDIT